MRAILLCLFLFPLGPAYAQEPPPDAPVSGKDITRPLERIDLRTEFAREEGESVRTITLRHDRPVELDKGWRLNLRLDLPFKRVEEDDAAASGLGDILVRAIAVREVDDRRAFGLGLQLRLPTAAEEALGRDQWQFLPTAGYRWSLPQMGEESFFQLIGRYRFSLGGDGDLPALSELQLAPNLEIGLPGRAYLSIFPSSDIRYDFRRNELFVPVNLEVGKEWSRLVASLEGGAALIAGDAAPYKWKVEARLGWRF